MLARNSYNIILFNSFNKFSIKLTPIQYTRFITYSCRFCVSVKMVLLRRVDVTHITSHQDTFTTVQYHFTEAQKQHGYVIYEYIE
jgi:hypothetical protein